MRGVLLGPHSPQEGGTQQSSCARSITVLYSQSLDTDILATRGVPLCLHSMVPVPRDLCIGGMGGVAGGAHVLCRWRVRMWCLPWRPLWRTLGARWRPLLSASASTSPRRSGDYRQARRSQHMIGHVHTRQSVPWELDGLASSCRARRWASCNSVSVIMQLAGHHKF